MYKNVRFGPASTYRTVREDGVIHFGSTQKLDTYPMRLTERLEFWAETKPDRVFIAARQNGAWNKLTYKETLEQVKCIAQFLIDKKLQPGDTLVILSENSLEHALLSLAAIHIGITFSPVSPPYSLVSDDLGKLRHCLDLMSPKLIFAQSASMYEKALKLSGQLFPEAILLTADGSLGLDFKQALQTKAGTQVEELASRVNSDTIAKVLFTSGSTGMPKGVMNHQGMWCANLQQITQVFPFMKEESPVFIDWLPWNHTFGGNHNFGLTLYNGGTLFIDDGKPTAKGIEHTVQNLREISPTAYFNVPKGFEMLIPYLESDTALRENFFRNLNILFYAGASLAQPVWNRLEELALETIGVRIPIITGLGCTEAGPSAMFANWGGSFSGLLGVPVAGLDVKLVPDLDKLEARYKAPNITKGYWKNEEETLRVFDEEGYYKTGDAVKFLDESNPDKGLVFDGRIAEDFKLSTGTWVNVGVLKGKIISSGSPVIQDVVLTGLDREFVGAILFLNADACRKLSGELDSSVPFEHPAVSEFLENWKEAFNQTATGSSNTIGKFIVATEPPSIDLGEITDKGSLNQRMVLKHRVHLVELLYKTDVA